MVDYVRYAVFYAPPEGSAMARFGADWLGWDAAAGCETRPVDPPEGWEAATRTPRKYGFHGTLKPPFRLADQVEPEALREAVRALAGISSPVRCPPLALSRLGGFLALVPSAPCDSLAKVAGDAVATLDGFRAPATEAELAKRRAGGLSPDQDAYLLRYGYPYVFDAFRFHLTLTGRLDDRMADTMEAQLIDRTAPFTATPFEMAELCLFGEQTDGRFRILDRYEL